MSMDTFMQILPTIHPFFFCMFLPLLLVEDISVSFWTWVWNSVVKLLIKRQFEKLNNRKVRNGYIVFVSILGIYGLTKV